MAFVLDDGTTESAQQAYNDWKASQPAPQPQGVDINPDSPRAFNTSQGYFEPTASGAPPMASTQSTYKSGALAGNTINYGSTYQPITPVNGYTPQGYSPDSPYNIADTGVGYGGQRGGGVVDVNETTINPYVEPQYGPSNQQLGVPDASWGYGYENGRLPTTFNADIGQYTGSLTEPFNYAPRIYPDAFNYGAGIGYGGGGLADVNEGPTGLSYAPYGSDSQGRRQTGIGGLSAVYSEPPPPDWYDAFRQRVDAYNTYFSNQDNYDRFIAPATPIGGGLADVNETPVGRQFIGPDNATGPTIGPPQQRQYEPTSAQDWMRLASQGALLNAPDKPNALQTFTSGNTFVNQLTKGNVDLSNLPLGLSTVTDVALAPATALTAVLGPEAPIIGSVFKGGILPRYLGETAVGVGGLGSSEVANRVLPEDMDPTLRALLTTGAGVVGGLGTYGAIRVGGNINSALRGVSEQGAGSALRSGALNGAPPPSPEAVAAARGIVARAEQQAPDFLGAVRQAADQAGVNYLPETEVNAVKSVNRTAEKVDAGRAVTDSLRTTVATDTPLESADDFVRGMEAQGFKPLGGAEDRWTNRAANYGYGDVTMKFEKGGVVSEVQAMPDWMFAAKESGGHDYYDRIRALEPFEGSSPQVDSELARLRADMTKHYADAEIQSSKTVARGGTLPDAMSRPMPTQPSTVDAVSRGPNSAARAASESDVNFAPNSASLRSSGVNAESLSNPEVIGKTPGEGTPRSISRLLADEQGGGVLPGLRDSIPFGGIAREAGRVLGHSAVGAGMGAAIGAYAGEGDPNAILKGAEIGALSGAGFRALAGTAGKLAERGIAERAAARRAALGVPEPPAAVSKLTAILQEAKPARVRAEQLKSTALRQKAAKLHGVYDSAGGEAAFQRAPAALVGELPKGAFDAPRPSFTQQEVDDLFNHIIKNPLVAGPNRERIFNVFNTQGALTKVLAGELPTNGEIQLLEKAFGPDMAKALLKQRSFGAKAMQTALDAINIPRTLVTAFDASAPLRQGAIISAGHPIAALKATGAMIRAMASPEYAKYVADGIEASPNMPIYDRMKLYFAPAETAGNVSGREEAFMSRLAQRIPGIGGSARGYTTYLNKLRQDVADSWIRTLSPEQRSDSAVLEQMGNWINVATGRGKLPATADRVLAASNGFLFAPRYAVSRLQVPAELFQVVNPLSGRAATVRKEVARDLTAFIGTGMTILSLGKMAGWWDAEVDPRSTDFGKIRIGATRFDMWAGEQQPIRTIAQFITGQRKSTSTGQIINTDRSDTVLRFLRSKVSPAAGLAWDVGEGKTFIGEDISPDKATLYGQAFQRLMPLFIQDVTEAAMEAGWKSALMTLPSAAGVGVQTYLSTRDIQDTVAKEKFNKPYLDLTKGERDIVNTDQRVIDKTSQYNSNGPVNPSQFFDRKDQYEQELEAKLRTQINQGLSGKGLKDAVSDFKQNRWTASQALLGGDAVQQAIANGTPKTQVADKLAEAYWSAPLPETVNAQGEVQLDFDAQNAARAAILQQARAAGIDANYITGSGLGTYRGERFADPVVRAAVDKVEAQQKQIEDSGYWNLRDTAWADLRKQYPDVLGQYQTLDDWKTAMAQQLIPQYLSAGFNQQAAEIEARVKVDGMPLSQNFADYYDKKYRLPWLLDHKDVARTLQQLGYVTFNQPERAYLGLQQ